MAAEMAQLSPSSQGRSATGTAHPPRQRPMSQTSINIACDDSTGPARLPKQMTAAELHHELEREQEAMVNRLTRELSELRARTNSVTSTTSTTSTSSTLDQASAPRSSSTVSSRSTTGGSLPHHGTSQASVDRARDTVGVSTRSRSNSVLLPAIASTPAPVPPRDLPSSQSRGPCVPPSPVAHQQGAAYFPSISPDASAEPESVAFSKQEEAAAAKAALEVMRRENEALAARVRELETLLQMRNEQSTLGGTD